ncbi:hypothetical protein ACIRRH_25315 [Kitasatospora sp. NPDC101235]|uniref:hypothetical protein n=1 Tax=Kitasatospora sp. NPDC101235 TaxID=3364101 RepID=UPI0037FD0BA4
MSELAATLIGAGGALAGVAISGMFSMMQARRASEERQLDRLEQRRASDREARRDLYAQLVSVARRAVAANEVLWRASPAELEGTDAQAVADAEELVAEFEHAANLVMLAGPPQLAEQAKQLLWVYEDSLATAKAIAKENPGSAGRVWQLATPGQARIDEALGEARMAFIADARKALGGDDLLSSSAQEVAGSAQ